MNFSDSPFELPATLRDWPADSDSRRAGVSSFGVGGTNAHVVVEEAPAPEVRPAAPGPQLLPVSAKSPGSLRRMMSALGDEFARHPDLSLEGVAGTLQVGRNTYPYRSYLVCDRIEDARIRLANAENTIIAHATEGRSPGVVFLLPGQGSQQLNATWELYERQSHFRAPLDECVEIVRQYTGDDLRDWLYTSRQSAGIERSNTHIDQTSIAQPLLFSVEYALARFWESLGIRPVAMLGHSLGEYVAACIAGVFTVAEALSLVIVRGRLMQSLPSGKMLAISCGEARVRDLLAHSGCGLAAINSPGQCVATGPAEDITALQRRLENAGIGSNTLRTSHAFHSRMMDPILDTYVRCVAEVERKRPSIPFISNVTGGWITDEEATSPFYWARHLRETVRFGDGVQKLLATGNNVLLEVGPGHTLATLVKQSEGSAQAIPSLGYGRRTPDEWHAVLETVGQLWRYGVDIDWASLHDGRHMRRVPLPSYAFDRKRHWLPRRAHLGSARPAGAEAANGIEVESSDPESLIPDRGAHERPKLDTEYIAPQGDSETRLAGIWRSFLGIEKVGVRDNFFELGGDSLLATRVYARIREEFNIELPISKMFDLATIRRLSLYISITRDPGLIDSLPEEDLNDYVAAMES